MNNKDIRGSHVPLITKRDVCRFCKHAFLMPTQDGPSNLPPLPASPDPGICKRFPPVIVQNGQVPVARSDAGDVVYQFQMQAAQPRISFEDFCGEYRPRIDIAN